MPLEESFAIIEKGSGTDFDPALAGLFLDAREDVTQIVQESFPLFPEQNIGADSLLTLRAHLQNSGCDSKRRSRS